MTATIDPIFVNVSYRLIEYIDRAITIPPKHQFFERADPEYPHYLRSYSEDIIKVARVVLVLTTGSGSFKGITSQQFKNLVVDIVQAGVEVDGSSVRVQSYRSQYGSNPILHSPRTLISLGTPSQVHHRHVVRLTNEGSEADSSDSSTTDDEDYLFEEDSVSDMSIDDRDTEDITEIRSEFDYNYFLEQWKLNEAKEELLDVDLDVLLTNSCTRKFTVDILSGTLGISPNGSNKEIKANTEAVLRKLRLRYRLAHTRPFLPHTLPYDGPMTPLIKNYLALSDAAVLLRTIELHIRDVLTVSAIHRFRQMHLATIRLEKGLDHLPGFQEVFEKRTWICHIRLNRTLEIYYLLTLISAATQGLYTLKGLRTSEPTMTTIKEKGQALLEALQNLANFENEKLAKLYFFEFPAFLIKDFGLFKVLDSVVDFKYVSEFSGDEEVQKAINLAGALLNKWQQRACNSTNSLYVPLDSYKPIQEIT